MSDALYGKPAENTGSVREKLKLFPEVHMYKDERRPARIKPVEAAPRNKREGRKLERVFIVVILFLVLVLAGELVFHFLISPKLMIRKIVITTGPNLALADREVLRLAEIDKDLFYFNVDPEEISELLGSYPLIQKAEVGKKFPDSLYIDITGREPLGVSIVDTGDGAVPIVFDQEGVVFQIGTSVVDMNNLVISGIVFRNIRLGMKLPEEVLGLLRDLYTLKTESPRLFSLLSEVKIVKRSSSQYEAVLYFSGYHMPVRTGMSIDETELKYILMVLDVVTIEDLEKRVRELDLRSGEVVYKVKEVPSGE